MLPFRSFVGVARVWARATKAYLRLRKREMLVYPGGLPVYLHKCKGIRRRRLRRFRPQLRPTNFGTPPSRSISPTPAIRPLTFIAEGAAEATRRDNTGENSVGARQRFFM